MANKLREKSQTPQNPGDHVTWPGLHQLDAWRRQMAPAEHGAQAMTTVQLAGKVPRIVFLEHCYAMEEKFPGRGWQQTIDELEKFYHKHGLALSEKPKIETLGGEQGGK